MSSKLKEWVLDDGSVWTTAKVMLLLDCSISSAYYRLTKSSKASVVLRPKEIHKIHKGKRLYVLDDGTEWTSTMVAKHTGCLPSTASTRLSTYTDPAKVLANPLGQMCKGKTVNESVKKRMLYDPLGHWKLINRYT
jgi:hypothetical protein